MVCGRGFHEVLRPNARRRDGHAVMTKVRFMIRLAVRTLVGAMINGVQVKSVLPLLNRMCHLYRLSKRKDAKRKEQEDHRSSQAGFAYH